MSYFVGSIKNTGHPFATYLIGEYISEGDDHYMVNNVLRAMETGSQSPKGFQINTLYLADEFFTSEVPVKIEKNNLLLAKVLDPDIDSKNIRQIENQYAGIRMAKTGLVSAPPAANPMNFNRVRE
jgi:hypothetical protein